MRGHGVGVRPSGNGGLYGSRETSVSSPVRTGVALGRDRGFKCTGAEDWLSWFV